VSDTSSRNPNLEVRSSRTLHDTASYCSARPDPLSASSRMTVDLYERKENVTKF